MFPNPPTTSGKLKNLCVIAGTAKCGTSSLQNYLKRHPYFAKPQSKEIRFFSSHPRRRFHTWSDYYKELHFTSEKQKRGMWFLDATGSFDRDHKGLARLAKHVPTAKLVILLRHPVDRLFSNYIMSNNLNSLPLKDRQRCAKYVTIVSPQVTFQQYATRLITKRTDENVVAYDENVSAIYKYYPPSQVLILKSEDLFAHPQQVCNRVFTFLGLPLYELSEFVKIAPFKHVHRKRATKKLSRTDLEHVRPYFEDMQKRLQDVLEKKGQIQDWIPWDL